jgi:type III restriction enzyme
LTSKQQAEFLRRQVDTVGQLGKAGEQIQSVVSVGMPEGVGRRDRHQIMGLRAWQVVGHEPRRTAYELTAEGLFDTEYVNTFAVPFTFLPHEIRQ